MKKQFLLLVALVASVFTTANAQVEYGNVTTPLTGAKTWDFSNFPGLEDGNVSDACTIDNLYFGVSGDTMYYVAANQRISLPFSANQTWLGDDATDCVLSFKIPAGEGTITINGKGAAYKRPGIVYVGKKDFREEGDSIINVVQDYKYHVNVSEPTSVYFVAENAKVGKTPAKGQGLFVYKITWTPGSTTGISQIVEKTKNDGAYYNLQGMRITAPKKGIYIRNGKKVVVE